MRIFVKTDFMNKLFFVSTFLITSLIVNAQDYTRVDTVMNHFIKHDRFMGAVSLKKGNNLPKTYVAGFASIESRAAVNANTTFRIGSITKMFTSVMILQLAEEGKLSLNDKLSKYYPEFKNSDKISIEDMLYHQSGLHNFTDEPDYLAYMEIPQTHEEMLTKMSAFPADFKPDAQNSYSNTNYVLLGYIIEQVSGSTYKIELEKRIIQPLGLKHTSAGFPGQSELNEAYSYGDATVKWIPSTSTHLSIPHGAGMIVSNTADLCYFIEALFQGKLISEKSLKSMIEFKGRYGKGIFTIPFYESVSYGHTGGIDAFVSSLSYFPEDSLAIAICLNGVRSTPDDLAIGALSMLMDKPYTFPDFSKKAVELSQEQLKRCEGLFSSPEFPLKISFKVKDGLLFAQATGQSEFPLEALSETEFRFEMAGILIEFKPAADGEKMNVFVLTQMGKSTEFTRE